MSGNYAKLSKAQLVERLRHAEAALEHAGGRRVFDPCEDALREQALAIQDQLIETQQLLQESRDRYADLYEFAPVAYLTLDKSGIIQKLNVAASLLLRQPRSRVLGRLIYQFIENASYRPVFDYLAHLPEASLHEEPRAIEVNLKVDGSLVAVSIQAASIEGGAGPLRLVAMTDISERREHERHLRTLLDELSHRVKNTLTTVISVAAQTATRSADLQAFQRAFEGRLLAMAEAHRMLSASNWQGAEIGQLVRRTLRPYCGDSPRNVAIEGKPTTLSPRASLTMSMVLHELATNAAKYGSMSKPGGSVTVRWNVNATDHGNVLQFEWLESGGPAVEVPDHSGFGTGFIQQSISYELGGETDLAFEQSGVHCSIRFPMNAASL